MNFQELKDKVSLSMTKDEVRTYGDLRLRDTWEAAYTTISSTDVTSCATSATTETTVSLSQDETTSLAGTIGYIVGLLYVTAIYIYRAAVSYATVPQSLMQVTLAYYTYYKHTTRHWMAQLQHRLGLWLSSNISILRYQIRT
jgi:hypothetical protein